MSPHDNSERETLSALFDGELQGDARRFASRRLAHDTGWQDDCGRWQLIGDAMRRQAPIAAPGGFAERVERAVAQEAAVNVVPQPAIAAASPRRPVRLWAGGALAASLALLAVFATRSPAPAPAAPASTVSTAPASAPVTAAATGLASTSPPADTLDTSRPASTEPAAERVAVSDPAPARAAPRASRRSAGVELPGTASTQPPAVLATAAFPAPDASNPFHVPAADPLATRPWPRAALSAGGALTASYGNAGEGRGDSPSFYPFEPRTRVEPAIPADTP